HRIKKVLTWCSQFIKAYQTLILYTTICTNLLQIPYRSGKGNREDGSLRRRRITFHSFRRFVKTTISDLGYSDFSEWFIGHSGSTYWSKKRIRER
ncbi:MAG: hypothetical protein ACJ71I_08800, partial [Nitrososphaeraceae archaeon]